MCDESKREVFHDNMESGGQQGQYFDGITGMPVAPPFDLAVKALARAVLDLKKCEGDHSGLTAGVCSVCDQPRSWHGLGGEVNVLINEEHKKFRNPIQLALVGETADESKRLGYAVPQEVLANTAADVKPQCRWMMTPDDADALHPNFSGAHPEDHWCARIGCVPMPAIKGLGYTPRGDRVIVKVLDRPEAPAGELSAPKSQQKPLDEGIVVAVGPDKSVSDILIGQHVCFLEYAGTEIEVDGVIYKSLRDSEIHGKRG